MLRRNKHTGPRPQILGRRRLLDPEKKVDLCELVAKGATVEDAAETVGVSLRTVQRERKLDEDFDHELQLSLRQAPDPLKMMQHAARAHWRAAAWLLRTDRPGALRQAPQKLRQPRAVPRRTGVRHGGGASRHSRRSCTNKSTST